jgi:hypothetical protein
VEGGGAKKVKNHPRSIVKVENLAWIVGKAADWLVRIDDRATPRGPLLPRSGRARRTFAGVQLITSTSPL